MGWGYNKEGATTSMSVLCASKVRTTGQLLLWRRMCVCAYGGQVVTAFSRQVEKMSPVPVVGHEEQHLADAAEAIFQRGEGQKWQLGSAF